MKKYMKFYKKCTETPKESFFLCKNFIDDKNFDLFKPTDEELVNHVKDGYNLNAWGSINAEIFGKEKDMVTSGFTPLRQTIVLFLAAMNNEL